EKIDCTLLVKGSVDKAEWSITFQAIDDTQLQIGVKVAKPWNRIFLHLTAVPNENIFGFGTQLSRLDMKGYKLPMLTREPGIGRGVQPLSFFMKHLFGASGEWHCTSSPIAWYLSTSMRGFGLENYEYSVFDFEDPTKHVICVYGSSLRGRFHYGVTPKDLLTSHTKYCGRMPALPDWIHKGAIIGLQGGSERVRKLQEVLEQYDVPVAAYWLQDWVGGRKTSIGKQLWWNWELDKTRYPDWGQLTQELNEKNILVMTYINPFLVDAQEKGDVRRDLLAEAKEQGFLIKNQKGEIYPIQNTSFHAYLVDLSNPKARTWLKDIIKVQMIQTGARGWMADFAEALPYDAVMHTGTTQEWHNRYPVEWAKLNREAIAEAGFEGEIVFFNRAGFSQSPQYSTLFWMGDQLADWGREDGLQSAINGLISSGLSGISINHGDIGGYIATTVPNFPLPIPGISYVRRKELLMRWIECFAFTSIFRTHEGNQPDRHIQIDADDELLKHFSFFSRVFAVLAPYRKELMKEAESNGLPLVRHLWLEFPDDPVAKTIELSFMLGDALLVAPVVVPKASKKKVYIPAGTWIHIWTNDTVQNGWIDVEAPIGKPPAFVRKGSDIEGLFTFFVD
ncbi:MAG: alpha-glucosidase, partial [Myxococcota bacterium]|nr:alpha-glucosidase [Myxococcota bacterium]